MLFPEDLVKPKLPAAPRKRKRFRIPTGLPKLVESSALYRERAAAFAWKRLLDAIESASIARLALLKGRTGGEHTPCPWEQFTGCSIDCRCRGKRAVTVDFLRLHYGRLAIEIALFVQPSSSHRQKQGQRKRNSKSVQKRIKP